MYLHPLNPSSTPSSSNLIPKRKQIEQICESEFKLRKLNDLKEEDNGMQINSNITFTNNLVSEPEGGLEGGLVITSEDTQKSSAKTQLYKLCGVNHWKKPVYEYFSDGPCHMKTFTVKVTVEIKENSGVTVLECLGDPQHKKKMAGEQAAEAALWYLKNISHNLQTEKVSGRESKQNRFRR